MKILRILMVVFVLSNCASISEKNLDKSKIVKEIVGTFFEEFQESNKSFLINPYYMSFDFKTRIDSKGEENIRRLFDLKGIKEEDFVNLKNIVNKKYKGKVSEELFNLSGSERSNYIFNFSGFSEDIVFVDILKFEEEYLKENLMSTPLDLSKKPKKGVEFSFVVLIENSKIKEMFLLYAIAYGL